MNMRDVQILSLGEKFISYFRFVFVEGFGPTTGYPNVIASVFRFLPYTLLLFGLSAMIAIVVGVAFGVFASYKHGTKMAALLTIFLIIPFMIPSWWLSLLSRITAYRLHLPYLFSGWYSIEWDLEKIPKWSNPLGFMGDVMLHIYIPMIALALSIMGVYFVVARSSVLNVFTERYMLIAKAKGLSPRRIMFKHALRNAIIPITVALTLTPPLIIHESIMIETTWNKPGIGRKLYESLVSPWQSQIRPQPTADVQAIFLTFAVLMVVGYFVLDTVHHALDPRLRTETDGGFLSSAKDKLKPRPWKWKFFWLRFKESKLGLIGLAVILAFVFFGVMSPLLPNPVTTAPNILFSNQPPSFEHWLGTDEWGRDTLTKLIWGARVSLVEVFGAVLIAVSVGWFVGLLSGYYNGRWYSYLLDRVTDVFLSMPLLVFVVSVGFYLVGPRGLETHPFKWIIPVGLATWGVTAKLVRSHVLTIRERAYVDTARAAGASDRYIWLHYIFPEAFSAVASSMIYVVAVIISIQSSLDYLGFYRFFTDPGASKEAPPFISWGNMLSYSSASFAQTHGAIWWTVIPPLLCIAALGLCLIIVSDRVAYALNPKL